MPILSIICINYSYLSSNPCFNKKFWEGPIAYSPLIQHRPHRKQHPQQFLVAAGTLLPSFYLVTLGGYTVTPTGSALTCHGPYRKGRLLLLHVFVAMGTCLPSHCLTAICRDSHKDTQTDEIDLHGVSRIR